MRKESAKKKLSDSKDSFFCIVLYTKVPFGYDNVFGLQTASAGYVGSTFLADVACT